MGKRGPPKTPTAVLALRGSWRAKERADEPQAEGKPVCPQWVSREVRKVWRQVVPALTKMNVAKKPDGSTLLRYCHMLVRWASAARFLDEHGETYPLYETRTDKKTGETTKIFKCFMPFPQAAIYNRLSQNLLRLEQEFGLTPAARAELKIEPPRREDPTSKLIGDVRRHRAEAEAAAAEQGEEAG